MKRIAKQKFFKMMARKRGHTIAEMADRLNVSGATVLAWVNEANLVRCSDLKYRGSNVRVASASKWPDGIMIARPKSWKAPTVAAAMVAMAKCAGQ
jgi:transposase